jgi:hypothetical protein
VVQSPLGISARNEVGGALFALEVRELEMPPLEDAGRPDRVSPPGRQPQALLAGAAPVQLLSAPERSVDTVDRTSSAPAESATGRSKAHFQVRELPELAFAGLGKSKSKRKRQKSDQALDGEQALCTQEPLLCAAGDAFAASSDGQPCGMQCVLGAPHTAPDPPDLIALVNNARTGSEPAVRGRHVLRADLYDGMLFRPDEAMQLFSGVLSPRMGRADTTRASAELAPKASAQPAERHTP